MKADRLERMSSSRQRGWPVAEWLSQAGTGPIPRTRGDETLRPPLEKPQLHGGGREEAALILTPSSLVDTFLQDSEAPFKRGDADTTPRALQNMRITHNRTACHRI